MMRNSKFRNWNPSLKFVLRETRSHQSDSTIIIIGTYFHKQTTIAFLRRSILVFIVDRHPTYSTIQHELVYLSQFIEFLMNGQQLCLSKNNEIRVGFWFGSLSFSLPLFVLKNVSNSLKQNEGQHKHIVNFCFVLSISVWRRYAASGTFMRVCDDGWMNLYDNCTPICFMLISLKEITLSLDCYTSSTIKFKEWTLPRIFVRTSWFIANLSLCMQNVF